MKKLSYLSALILCIAIWSCDSESSARLEIRLTDAPGDYEEVNIEVQGVEIHTTGGTQQLEIEEGLYNVLEFTNGQDTLLGISEIPAGRISQIRLILGENNSVKIDGQDFELATPSALQSGLKLNVQTELVEGVTYTFTLDFDAARSIVKTGSGAYSLKPVIRVLNEATSGAIKGTVSPVEASPAVFAITATQDTVATAYTDEAGKFLLRGIPEGTYTVAFDPKTGFMPLEESDVTVAIGSVTDLGVITIQQ